MVQTHTEHTLFKELRTPHFFRRLIVAVLVCVCVCGGAWGDQTWDASTTNIGNLSTSETITLSSDVTLSENLNWYPVSNDNLLVIELKGYTLKATTLNLGPSTSNNDNPPMGFKPNMKIIGPGTLEVSTFDSNQTQNCKLTMEKNVIFTVTRTFWGNMDDGKSTKIEGDESCSIKMPAEIKVDSGVNRIEITDEIEVTTKAGDYQFTISPGLISGGTSEVTVTNTTTAFSSINYSISSGSNLVTFDGVSASNGTLTWATAAKEQTFSINIAALTTNQTISMEFKDVTGSTVLKSLKYEYTKPAAGTPSTSTAWTGAAGDGKWSNATNWSEGIPSSTTYKVTIPFVAGKDTVTVDNAVQINNLTVNVSPGVTLKVENNFVCSSVRNSGSIELAANQTMSVTGYFRNYGTLKLQSSSISAVTKENGPNSTIEYVCENASLSTWGSSYNNLILSGGGTVTLSENITVAGKLTIGANTTLDCNGHTITAGFIDNNGTLIISSSTSLSVSGTKINGTGSTIRIKDTYPVSSLSDLEAVWGKKFESLYIEDVTYFEDLSDINAADAGKLYYSSIIPAISFAPMVVTGRLGDDGEITVSVSSTATASPASDPQLKFKKLLISGITGNTLTDSVITPTDGSVSGTPDKTVTFDSAATSHSFTLKLPATISESDELQVSVSIPGISTPVGSLSYFAKTEWTGAGTVGTTWNTDDNWTHGVPAGATRFAVIPGSLSNYPVLSSAVNCPLMNLTVNSGAEIDANGNNITVSKITNSGTIKLKGIEVISGTKENSSGSSIEYTEADAALVWGDSYSNIVFSGSGKSTLLSDIACTKLDIKNGSELDIGTHTVSLSGDLTNSGTLTATSGTIAFTGASTVTGGVTFGTVTIADGGSVTTDSSSYTFTGNFTSTGAISSAADGEMTFVKDFSNTGTIDLAGKTTFSGDSAQAITAGTTQAFADVTVSGAGGISLGSNLQIGALTTAGGNINLNGNKLSIGGNWTHNSGSITDSAAGGSIEFTGSTELSGTEPLSLPSITVAAGKTLTLQKDVTFTGNVTNNGTFTAGTGSTVTFGGAANSTSTITGDNTWYNLTCTTAGKTLVFEAGKTQTIAPGGKLTLTGGSATNEEITICSATAGSPWTLTVAPEQLDLTQVLVKDCTSTNDLAETVDVPGTTVKDGGGNTRWFVTLTTYTWIGTDNDWSKTTNWKRGTREPSAPPDAANMALELTFAEDIKLDRDISVKTVTVPAAKTLSLGTHTVTAADVTVNGRIVTDGTVTNQLFGANSVVWGTSSSIEYTGSGNATDALHGAPAVVFSKTGGTFTAANAMPNATVQSGILNLSGAAVFAENLTISPSATVAASGTMSIAGNWTNNGTFTAGTGSTVTFGGAANSTSTITGDNTWYNLTCTTAGKTLAFEAGKTQTIASGGTLTLTGGTASGEYITICSTANGSLWNLDVAPSACNVAYVNVKDSRALQNLVSVIDLAKVFDGGNTIFWFLGSDQVIQISWALAEYGEKNLYVAFSEPIDTTNLEEIPKALNLTGDGSIAIAGGVQAVVVKQTADSTVLKISLNTPVTIDCIKNGQITADMTAYDKIHTIGLQPKVLSRATAVTLLPLVVQGFTPILAVQTTDAGAKSVRAFDGRGTPENTLQDDVGFTLQTRSTGSLTGRLLITQDMLWQSADSPESLVQWLEQNVAATGSYEIAPENAAVNHVVPDRVVASLDAGKPACFYYRLYDGRTALVNRDGKQLFAVWSPESKPWDSVSLWSVRLSGISTQAGGVTIRNNVINAAAGEEAIIQVELSERGPVTVQILTLDGNIVTTLQRGTKAAGTHIFRWNGTNKNGAAVARGMYFVKVTGKDIDQTRKVMVVRE